MSDGGIPNNLMRRPENHRATSQDMSPTRDPWGRPIQTDDPPIRQQTDQNNKKPDDNDTGIDDKEIDNIWEDVKAKTPEPKEPNNNQPAPIVDQKKQVDDYLVSIGLEPLTLNDAEKEEMKNGEFGTVLAKMNDKIRNAHLKAMSGSKTMIDAAVSAAVKTAMDSANATFSGNMNLNALHAALPFTKDKAFGPVAETVMQKFLNRGLTTEDAIDGTRRYFAKLSDTVSASNVNKNRNGNFGGSRPNPTENEAPEGGWLNILRGSGNNT